MFLPLWLQDNKQLKMSWFWVISWTNHINYPWISYEKWNNSFLSQCQKTGLNDRILLRVHGNQVRLTSFNDLLTGRSDHCELIWSQLWGRTGRTCDCGHLCVKCSKWSSESFPSQPQHLTCRRQEGTMSLLVAVFLRLGDKGTAHARALKGPGSPTLLCPWTHRGV